MESSQIEMWREKDEERKQNRTFKNYGAISNVYHVHNWNTRR